MKNLRSVVLAFLFRSWSLTRRNIAWFLANSVYKAAAAATVVLIGRALGSDELTTCLLVGSLVWTHLALLLDDITHNITFERWEDTIEYTLAAPISRMAHLFGVALYGFLRATVQTSIVFALLTTIIAIPLTLLTGVKLMAVVAVSSLAFYGLGMAVATLPLVSGEFGPQGAQIVNGLILLISGVNYPISLLPNWLQWVAKLSPATYALEAGRKLAGVKFAEDLGVTAQPAAGLFQILPEFAVLLGLGVIYIPLGMLIFSLVESYGRVHGLFKRNG